ncbi:peroxiredoxin family protein [bacterium]|nr:peroxiredoxin family protein [bacterium]
MESNIPDIGQKALDFQVKNQNGGEFQLKNALSNGKNLMLVFYRGHW